MELDTACGTSWAQNTLAVKGHKLPILYFVTNISNLNFLGRQAIATLNISNNKILFCSSSTSMDVKSLSPSSDEQNLELQEAYAMRCDDNGELFKPELGRLKNFKLEIRFNRKADPIFCKPRSVPFFHTIQFDAGLRCLCKKRNLDTSSIEIILLQ